MTSFGGGQKSQIRRATVGRGWLSDEVFVEALEVTQIMPGANVLNLAVYLGRYVGGIPGAVVAVLAGSVPPFFIVLAAGWWYFSPYNTPAFHAALMGCAAGAIGLTLANAIELSAEQRSRPVNLAIVAATALAVVLLRLSLPLTLAAFGTLGIGYYLLTRARVKVPT